MDADAFELVLDFLYNPLRLDLSMQVVGPVLVVSQRLGIAAVKEECTNFLLRQLSITNCKHLHVLASTHGLAQLKQQAWELLCKRPEGSEQATPTQLLQQVARDCCLSRQPQFSAAPTAPSAQDVVEHWAQRLNGAGIH